MQKGGNEESAEDLSIMFHRKSRLHWDFPPPVQLTSVEKLILADLAARLALSRALSVVDNPSDFAKALGDDLHEFLTLHRVVGVSADKQYEAEEFLLHKAQELVAASAQHPAAVEPAAVAPRRTRR